MHCDLDLWPFDLKIYRAHPWLMGSLHVKFHDDRCKEKAVMRRKPFSVMYALIVTLTLDLLTSKSIGHILDSWGVCMWSFMMIDAKGKQLCAGNSNADGRRTDMVIPAYPPNFVAGGIMTIRLLAAPADLWGWGHLKVLCGVVDHNCSQTTTTFLTRRCPRWQRSPKWHWPWPTDPPNNREHLHITKFEADEV